MTESEFERIYLEHFDAVHAYVCKLCRNAQTADEITADTFFKAMHGIQHFEGRCSERSWLCQIAKNTFYSYLKAAKRMVSLDSVSEMGSPHPDLTEQLADAASATQILTALHGLPEPYKEVFHLRVFAELSFKQIAALFGKTENWACVTYHRAKSKIQTVLEDSK